MTSPPTEEFRTCKPVLAAPESMVAGHKALHVQEARYTAMALRETQAGIAVWHCCLMLLDRTLRGVHDSPFEALDDAQVAWHLRLALANGASATAKLALDAALAGYYSQVYALIRHLLETCLQMVYVRLNNPAAWQWFGSDTGTGPREPSQNTIINGIKRRGRGDSMLLHKLRP